MLTSGSLASTRLGSGAATNQAQRQLELSQYIENQTRIAENQEPTTAPLVPYGDVETAVTLARNNKPRTQNWPESPYYTSLDGDWNFFWALNHQVAPEMPPEDTDDWDAISVPNPWQIEGYGHVSYDVFLTSWQGYTPPNVPTNFNPTGNYQKSFSVPEDWLEDRQTFLRFDSVKAAFFVWVNGQYVGYNQGSMTPAEFDITPYLQEGTNTVSVQVFHWCDGSYLENQDMLRFAGIYRSVHLYSTPTTHIRDVFANGTLDGNYEDGQLSVDAEVANYDGQLPSGYAVRATLFDASGQRIGDTRRAVGAAPTKNLLGGMTGTATRTVSLSIPVDDPNTWSAENPYLYVLGLELLDDAGNTCEVLVDSVGFRTVEITGQQSQQVLINGEPVTVKGVNLHDHDPHHGRTTPVDSIRAQLEQMKRFNINAIRCSHYPRDPDFYDLCDQYGFYVCDEANVETHYLLAPSSPLSAVPSWEEAFLDRFRRMIKQNKNHPSIFMWSTGNEANTGQAHLAMAAYQKANDPSRLLFHQPNQPDGEAPFADVSGPRYSAPSGIRDMAESQQENRPIIMGEYCLAAGNTLGAPFQAYWDIIDEYPQVQGGFIWQWSNQAMEWPLRKATDKSGNGNDGLLCGNPKLASGVQPGETALRLSGLEDWVELYRDPSLNITGNRLTLELWVKPERIDPEHPRPKEATNPFLVKGEQYGLQAQGGRVLEFYAKIDGQRQSVSAPVPSNWTGEWHHVAGVYNGRELKVYIDGTEQNTASASGTIDHGHHPVTIGRGPRSVRMRTSKAEIDRVRIYDHDREFPQSPARLRRTHGSKAAANLWLDFDSIDRDGSFRFRGKPQTFWQLTGISFGPSEEIMPSLWEAKKVHEPVTVAASDLENGKINIRNDHRFTNLSEFDTVLSLQADGEVLERTVRQVSVPPGEERVVTAPFDRPESTVADECFFTIRVLRREATTWAPAGHEVAWEQLELPTEKPTRSAVNAEKLPNLQVTDETTHVTIEGPKFAYSLDKQLGTFDSLEFRNQQLVERGPLLNVWRAPVISDHGLLHQQSEVAATFGERSLAGDTSHAWRDAGLDRLAQTVDAVKVKKRSDSVVEIMIEAFTSGPGSSYGFETVYVYRVLGNGTILLAHRVTPEGSLDAPYLPKVGLQLELGEQFDTLAWHGCGPHETYPDRKRSGKVGAYTQAVTETTTPYRLPQDNGNKAAVRWTSVTDGRNNGLQVSGLSDLNVSTDPYENVDRASYQQQLQKADNVTLNVDHVISGVGTGLVGKPARYQIPTGETQRYVVGFRPWSRSASTLNVTRDRYPFISEMMDSL